MSTNIMFQHTRAALSKLEEKFKCNKCGKFASSPVTLGGCEHIFCNTCCEDYLGSSCPVCTLRADVKDANVDRQLFNLASLCAKLRQELSVAAKIHDDYKENEDPQIQSTPNQPIPGSIPHDQGHITSSKISPGRKQTTAGKKEALSPSVGKKTSVTRKRKPQENDQTKEQGSPVVRCPETSCIGSEGIQRKKTARRVTSPGGKSPRKRRKSVPLDQTTMTQFFEHDEENEMVNAEEISEIVSEKEGKSKNRKVQNKATKTQKCTGESKSKPKTRMRHSLDSNFGKLATPEKGTVAEKAKSKPKKGKLSKNAAELDSSMLNVSTSDAGSVGQKTPVSARSRSKSLSTPVSESKSIVRTPKGRQPSQLQKPAQSPALNKRNAKGETPLQVAAIKNDFGKVKELLEEGANPNVRDNAGWTPLHEACNHGYYEIAKILLDHGAMMNIPGLENDTPLHDAISNGRIDCVKLLVSRGASLTLRNMHGHTAFDLAATDAMKKALKTPIVSSVDTVTSEPVDVMEFQAPCLLGTGLSREEKVTLQKAASQLQVKLVDEVTPEVTHIVTKFNSDGMCPRTIKIVEGILMGKWILNMEWLETCTQVGSLVCEEAFEAQGTSLFPQAQAPSKGRINRKHQLPGLFDGCYFYFHGSFEYANPTKEDFIKIVTAGGGKLLNREPKPGHLDMEMTVPYHADASDEIAMCCVFLVHESTVNLKAIRTKYMCSVPASWIMDCAANFKLVKLPAVN